MKKDILVTEKIEGFAFDNLQNRFEVEYDPDLWRHPKFLLKAIPDFRAIITRNQTIINRELLTAAQRLEVIGRAGAGCDNIDLKAASKKGVVVAYTPEQNSISVAELTLALMVALARKIAPADRDTKSGHWNRHQFTGTELYGKTLGIVGMGRIGFRTAKRAEAMGMDIIANDEFVNPDGIMISELRIQLHSLSELLAKSDFVSCHLPLTPQTENLFDNAKFQMMKKTAYFINTSRGKIVDEQALIRVLKGGEIRGAALDVRFIEPPGRDDLSNLDNVILTPHIAAFTQEGQQRVVSSICEDVAAVLQGKAAKNFANFAIPEFID